MKPKSKRTKTPKALTGGRMADHVFAGLDAKRPQQFGCSLSRGRRGGR